MKVRLPSGRPAAKTCVEACAALDAQALDRAGYLEPGPWRRRFDLERRGRLVGTLNLVMSGDGLFLEGELYLGPGAQARVNSVLTVVRTPAINGGQRVWFSCPACKQRVSKLYLPPGKSVFLCRSCHNLTYASRQERPNVWRKAREEMRKLDKDLWNERLGVERRLRAAAGLAKWRTQLKSEATTIDPLVTGFFSPELRLLLADWETQKPRKRSRPATPAASAPPDKRPRGRPREKRPYERRKPFHQSQRRTPAEVFCVKCRAYRELREWQLVTFRNGRPALQGVCPSCGSKMARIISARAAAPLASIPARPPIGHELYDELLGLPPPPDHAG